MLIFNQQTVHYSICIFKQKRSSHFIAECFIKKPKCVYYFVHRYLYKPTENQILRDTLAYNCKSPRPYKAGQACDGSISAPVFHLYNQLCNMLGIDPITTYHSAYDDDRISKRDLSHIIRFAEWQGVEVILKWNEKKIQLVLESIHNVNMHQLANVLTEKL